MIIDTRPVDRWFDPHNYGEIQEKYDIKKFEGSYPDQLLSTLFTLTSFPNEGLLIPRTFETIPTELNIGGRVIEIPDSHTFKRFGLYVQISYDTSNPQEAAKDALHRITMRSNCLGYRWETTDLLKLVPFISLIEGLEYLAFSIDEIAREVRDRTGVIFGQLQPKIYAERLFWHLPSRHRIGVQHPTTIGPLGHSAYWGDLDSEHTCEDVLHKYRVIKEKRVRYFCDHLIAAFGLALLTAPPEKVPTNPFLVPKEWLVEIDDLLRYRVIKEYPDGRKGTLNEAERGRIFGWIVANYKRRLDDLFRTDYREVQWDKVIKFV